MASNHYYIIGVGTTLEFGKNGPKVLKEGTGFKVTTNGGLLTNLSVATPTLTDHAASKGYVDSLLTGGVNYRGTVDASAGDPAGAGVIGTPASGDMYRVTTAGSTAFGFQLNIGDYVIYNGTTWDKIDSTDPTVNGTTNRITVTPTGDSSYTVDIDANYVGQTSITTLGTITTGVWQGSVIGAAYGGTGFGSYATGDLLIGNGSGTLDKLTVGTTGQQLRVSASGTLEYFTPSVSNAFTNFTDGTNTATPDSDSGTLTFTGTNGVSVGVNASTDTITFQLDVVGLTDGTAVTIDPANDLFAMYDNSAGQVVKVTAQQIVDAAAIDRTRIRDTADTTYVDTDQTADNVVVAANSIEVARFNSVSGANSRVDITAGTAKVSLTAVGTPNDIDVNVVPKGTGKLVVGDSSANGLIQAADTFSMTVSGGDATGSNDAGDLILKGGNATGSGTDGKVVIQDGNGNSALTVSGTASAVNYIDVANSATGQAVKVQAKGTDANIDLELSAKGTGLINAPSGYDMSSGVANTLATKGYVDTALAALNPVGSVQTRVVDISNTTVNLGALVKGRVTKVKVNVLTPYSSGTIDIGISGDVGQLASNDLINEAVAGLYIVETDVNYASDTQLVATLAGAAGGAARVIIEYIVG